MFHCIEQHEEVRLLAAVELDMTGLNGFVVYYSSIATEQPLKTDI